MVINSSQRCSSIAAIALSIISQLAAQKTSVLPAGDWVGTLNEHAQFADNEKLRVLGPGIPVKLKCGTADENHTQPISIWLGDSTSEFTGSAQPIGMDSALLLFPGDLSPTQIKLVRISTPAGNQLEAEWFGMFASSPPMVRRRELHLARAKPEQLSSGVLPENKQGIEGSTRPTGWRARAFLCDVIQSQLRLKSQMRRDFEQLIPSQWTARLGDDGILITHPTLSRGDAVDIRLQQTEFPRFVYSILDDEGWPKDWRVTLQQFSIEALQAVASLSIAEIKPKFIVNGKIKPSRVWSTVEAVLQEQLSQEIDPVSREIGRTTASAKTKWRFVDGGTGFVTVERSTASLTIRQDEMAITYDIETFRRRISSAKWERITNVRTLQLRKGSIGSGVEIKSDSSDSPTSVIRRIRAELTLAKNKE